MIYGSVCSGIEAASVAWEPLGWKAAFFSEIEKFPARVLKTRFPGVKVYGDFTKIQADAGPVDVLVGGTPCQSFSIAGKRLGLDDPRGNLALEFLSLVRRLDARWFVWENVPGALSSRSEDGSSDFATFLGYIQQCGYGFAWRVLDAQFVRVDGYPRAVPQRRRRLFVVGHRGDWRRAAAVLLEPEGLRGDPAPRREAGKGTAYATAPCFTSGGRGVEMAGDTRRQDPVVAVSPTLRSGGNVTGGHRPPGTDVDTADSLVVAFGGNNQAGAINVATAVNAHGGPHGGLDFESETFVTHASRGEGFDASEDGSGRGTPLLPVAFRTAGDGAVYEEGDKAAPITTGTDPSANIIAFTAKDYGADAVEGLASTLRSGGFDKSHANGGVMPAIAIQERAVSENVAAGPDGIGIRDDGAAYTLEARTVPQAVAFDMRGRDGGAQLEGPHETANIRASSGGSSRSYVAGDQVGQAVAFAQNTRDEVRLVGGDGGVVGALAAEPGAKQQSYVAFSIMPMNSGKDYKARETEVAQPLMAGGPVSGNQGGDFIKHTLMVRRLTPVECERLQGFPDGWTDIGDGRGGPTPDGPRYKALGNSMAINVMRWIGMRIAIADEAFAKIDAGGVRK